MIRLYFALFGFLAASAAGAATASDAIIAAASAVLAGNIDFLSGWG
jgi:hypothetical protein